jgi:hypothetical protein
LTNGKDRHNPHYVIRPSKESDGPEEIIIILKLSFQQSADCCLYIQSCLGCDFAFFPFIYLLVFIASDTIQSEVLTGSLCK